MHIAAMDPQYVSKEDVPADAHAKEREIELERLKNDPKMASKPADVLNNIVDGRLSKFYESTVLLDQPFVKDLSLRVGVLVKALTGKIGEMISVRRFTRYKMGEGIEKKSGDFASEVAEMVKK
jgi:elongation factor Ts